MPDDERPTQPATPQALVNDPLPCPECGGTFLDCKLCAGKGQVTRETFTRWHAKRYGR